MWCAISLEVCHTRSYDFKAGSEMRCAFFSVPVWHSGEHQVCKLVAVLAVGLNPCFFPLLQSLAFVVQFMDTAWLASPSPGRKQQYDQYHHPSVFLFLSFLKKCENHSISGGS